MGQQQAAKHHIATKSHTEIAPTTDRYKDGQAPTAERTEHANDFLVRETRPLTDKNKEISLRRERCKMPDGIESHRWRPGLYVGRIIRRHLQMRSNAQLHNDHVHKHARRKDLRGWGMRHLSRCDVPLMGASRREGGSLIP